MEEEYTLEIYKPGQDWEGEATPFQSYTISLKNPINVSGLASNTHYTVVLRKDKEIIKIEDETLSTKQGNDEDEYDENGYYITFNDGQFKSFLNKEEIKEQEGLSYSIFKYNIEEPFETEIQLNDINNHISKMDDDYYIVLMDNEEVAAISEVIPFTK